MSRASEKTIPLNASCIVRDYTCSSKWRRNGDANLNKSFIKGDALPIHFYFIPINKPCPETVISSACGHIWFGSIFGDENASGKWCTTRLDEFIGNLIGRRIGCVFVLLWWTHSIFAGGVETSPRKIHEKMPSIEKDSGKQKWDLKFQIETSTIKRKLCRKPNESRGDRVRLPNQLHTVFQ